MNILKEDQKKHVSEFEEEFTTLHTCLRQVNDLVLYFYGEDSDVFKNYHEKAQSIFDATKDIRYYINEKYGE